MKSDGAQHLVLHFIGGSFGNLALELAHRGLTSSWDIGMAA